jgi:hypothetical protein
MRCTFFSHFFSRYETVELSTVTGTVIVTFFVGQHYVSCHFHVMYVPEAEIVVATLPILRREWLWTRVLRFTAGTRPTLLASSVSQ